VRNVYLCSASNACEIAPKQDQQKLARMTLHAPWFPSLTFSTFEELKTPMNWPMEDSGVVKLYEPFPTQHPASESTCLQSPARIWWAGPPYPSPIVSGRYLDSNNPSHVQQAQASSLKDAGFPFGCADAAAVDGRRRSNVCEVQANPWLWKFGRGKLRLGGLSIEKNAGRIHAAKDARHKRAAEIKRVRKTAPAKSVVDLRMYYNVHAIYRYILLYVAHT
jgi:hypothetical protein